MTIKKIVLIVAMKKEAEPIVEKLNMKLVPNALDDFLPAEAYEVTTEKGHCFTA